MNLNHAADMPEIDTSLGIKERKVIQMLFQTIPSDRLFGSISGIGKMQFKGGLEYIVKKLGRPHMMNILLSQEENGPEWRAIFRADFPKYGVLYGPFDPGSFIFMWNYRISTIEGVDIALHAIVGETVILNNALQPQIVRLDGDMFVYNALYPIFQEKTKLPSFMKNYG